MSYRNPQQYVDTTTAKSFQNLQQTIAGSFAGVAQSYAQAAERRRKENEKKEAENKLTIKRINKEVSTLRRNLNITDDKYKDTDWSSVYNPLIKEFESLSTSIEFGTSENPSADRIKRDEIYASVMGVENSIANVASYVDGMDEKIMNVDQQGGLYGGMDPNILKGLSIFAQQLPGKRQPRFVDGNVKKLVWDVYDDQGKIVQSFDAEKLERISKGLDELLITIPNQSENNKAAKLEMGTVFPTNDNGDYKGGIKPKFLGGIKSFDKQIDPETGNMRYATERSVNKFGRNGIIFDSEFNMVMNADIKEMLETNKDNTSAIAFNNSQFKDIRFDIQDFIDNPYFNGKYTKENLPEEIKAALKDKDGFQFDLNDPLTDVEKDIFSVAYKKHFLKNEVPDDIAGYSNTIPESELYNDDPSVDPLGYVKNRINNLIDIKIPQSPTSGRDFSPVSYNSAVETLSKSLGKKTSAMGKDGAIKVQEATYKELLDKYGETNKDVIDAKATLDDIKSGDSKALWIIRGDKAMKVENYDPSDTVSNLEVLLEYGDQLSAKEKSYLKSEIQRIREEQDPFNVD